MSLLEELYTLDRELGRGGMGVVWRATQRSLDRPVALKVLTEDLASDPEHHRRFIDEARLAAQITHPNVVRVLDFAVLPDGRAYIAYELIEGTDLETLLGRGPLPADHARRLAADLLSGLAAIHARGILHRDVKPANLLVGADGRARLIDLGIGREIADRRARTRTGVVLGTPGYIAPENIEGHPATPALDIYAAGGVLYALACGRPPYSGGTPIEVLTAQLHNAPLPPAHHRATADPLLSRLALTALARDPAARPSLASLLASLESTSPPPPSTPPVPALKRPLILTVSVSVSVLLLLALPLATRRLPPPSPTGSPTPTPTSAPTPTPTSAPPLIDRWHRAESAIRELRRQYRTPPRGLVNQIISACKADVDLGTEALPWIHWLEIGEWLQSSASAPKLTAETEIHPSEADTITLRIGSNFTKNADATFLRFAIRMISAAPMNGPGWLLLGRYLEQDGQMERARRVYALALERLRGPDELVGSFVGYYALVRALVLNQRDLAKNFWRHVSRDEAGRTPADALRFAAQREPGYEAAMRIALGRYKDEPYPECHLAGYLLDLKPNRTVADVRTAFALYRSAMRPDPDKPQAVRSLVLALLRVGRIDEARATMGSLPSVALRQIIEHCAAESSSNRLVETQGQYASELALVSAELETLRMCEAGLTDAALRLFILIITRPAGELRFRAAAPLHLIDLGATDPRLIQHAREHTMYSTPETMAYAWDVAAGTLASPRGVKLLHALLKEARAHGKLAGLADTAELVWRARHGRVAEALPALAPVLARERAEREEAWISEILSWAIWTKQQVPDPIAIAALRNAPAEHREYRERVLAGNRAGAGEIAAERLLARPDEPVWSLAVFAATRDRTRLRAVARMHHMLWMLKAPASGL